MRERQWANSLKLIDKGHRHRYEFAKTKVSGFVLDAACGCGYGSHMLSDVSEVTGIDLDEETIEFAKKVWTGPTYKLADVREPQGAFDWVVSFETLEHLPEPLPALKAFRESENLIISTPNQLRYPFRPESYEGDRFPHIRHYTPNELEALLEMAGWTPVERRGQETKKSEVTLGEGVFLVWVCK